MIDTNEGIKRIIGRDKEYENYMKKHKIKKGLNCPVCAAETYENYNFCNQCGYSLKR